jgi:hypothetical protein
MLKFVKVLAAFLLRSQFVLAAIVSIVTHAVVKVVVATAITS